MSPVSPSARIYLTAPIDSENEGAPMPSADRIYRGGTIHTVDSANPTTDAVAIADGQIIALGIADCDSVAGSDTEVVDLSGRTLIPAFHDAHAHPVLGGINLVHCNLDDIHGYRAYLERIAEYVHNHPEDEWVIGACWDGDGFEGGFTHRYDINVVIRDHPASINSLY